MAHEIKTKVRDVILINFSQSILLSENCSESHQDLAGLQPGVDPGDAPEHAAAGPGLPSCRGGGETLGDSSRSGPADHDQGAGT